MRNALRSNIVKRITGVWNLHSHLTPKHSESLDSFSFAKRSSHCPTILHQNIFLSDLLIARPYYIKAFPFTQRSYIKEFKKFILRGCVPFVTFQIHVCFFLDCLILPVNIDHHDCGIKLQYQIALKALKFHLHIHVTWFLLSHKIDFVPYFYTPIYQ